VHRWRLSSALIAAATVLALVSAWHSGRHMWRLLEREYVGYRTYSAVDRLHAPLLGLGVDPNVFDWYAQYLAPGDRVYYQVLQTPLSSFLDLPKAVSMGGAFYLLPTVAVGDVRKATVVVSYLADPGLLHVHFITQDRAGLQLMFVSRIQAPSS
jgi:hypothetical protein